VLAEIVRTDRAHHRPTAGDSELASVVKTLARTHQSMIWTRQRQTNQLRSMLREFYLAGRDALAVLAIAATPAEGRVLSRPTIATALRRAGRERNIDTRATQILESLRSDQLGLSDALTSAYGASVRSIVAVIATMVAQIAVPDGFAGDVTARCRKAASTALNAPDGPSTECDIDSHTVPPPLPGRTA